MNPHPPTEKILKPEKVVSRQQSLFIAQCLIVISMDYSQVILALHHYSGLLYTVIFRGLLHLCPQITQNYTPNPSIQILFHHLLLSRRCLVPLLLLRKHCLLALFLQQSCFVCLLYYLFFIASLRHKEKKINVTSISYRRYKHLLKCNLYHHVLLVKAQL